MNTNQIEHLLFNYCQKKRFSSMGFKFASHEESYLVFILIMVIRVSLDLKSLVFVSPCNY